MKIYISGGMSGYPQSNYPLFELAAKDLRARGHEVVSPRELDRPQEAEKVWGRPEDDGMSASDAEYAQLIERDTGTIDASFDAIAFLPGWEHSGGAGREGERMDAVGGMAFTWAPWNENGLEQLWWGDFYYRHTTERAVSVPEPAR